MSIFKTYSRDRMDEHLSNYLLNDWSYSKVTAFARNEKAFEMQYIYNERGQQSATTVAGSAYHAALDTYFRAKMLQQGSDDKKPLPDIIELEKEAFAYIDDVKANYWKIQKTTPTVEDCKQKANKTVSILLKNFFKDIEVYNDIKEILFVELYLDEFITVNGVDIPLPCHGRVDLGGISIENKLVIIDHKSKTAFSDEKELKFSGGVQAITYVLLYEENKGMNVDEVWFVENKISQNQDKSPQLKVFKFAVDENTRRLYEALLYEPLKRMIDAVHNADYIYLINDADNYTDTAELYEFWAKTMMAEIGEFDIIANKKELITRRLKKIRDTSVAAVNPKLISNFRKNAAEFIPYDFTNSNMTKEEKIEHVLRSFQAIVKVAHKFSGYSSDTYLLNVGAGVKITSIYSHRLDIASALNVENVRIPDKLTVHDGRSYLPVEVKKQREGDLIFRQEDLQGRRIPVGKDNFGNVIVWDLENQSSPHVLCCGGTGSGKSVFLNSTIEYAKLAGVDELVILDSKYSKELTAHRGAATVVNEIEEIEAYAELLVEEMNARVKSGKNRLTLIVFDEFADAIDQSKQGNALKIYKMVQVGVSKKGVPKMERQCVGEKKSLADNMKMLLQKGRSCGFRVLAATQRASVKVIGGDTKVNFPVQICFKVQKEVDSMVVLDEIGGESLAGRGDGLIKSPEYNGTVRFQAYYKA